jgi:hypothetical protein
MVRMKTLSDRVEWWHPACWVKTHQAEALIGPVAIFARSGVPCPTAGMAEPLHFCLEFPLAHPERDVFQ